MKKTLMMTAALVAAAVTLGACGTSTTSAGPSSSDKTTTTQPATSAEHNHADEMFARMMIPHHQQAIEMSDMILGKQGVDPKVIALATQIKAAQGPEIQQMQGWLTQWGATGMSPSSGMPGMPGMPGTSGMPGMPGMPGMQPGQGMMSEQDMAALQNAQGVTASKLFLTQMIAHHQGAITMAETEITTGQSPDAVALANSIKTSQQREIDTMKTLLGSL
ncbi:uncharacterized protein (DUF305 family) [Mycolicibacterium fluoranthenivorans]|uniref:Uncharacterized protein (DUF305 family) n=2 Tax=Mycolicibacterium fluoranthenivorans TaxID=258505 RepID=A0A7X5U5I5_9MYCO|nr:uncharacterized protein (DUF305 family) [Mycolicibacterium fluoranthenivorans]